MSSPSRLVRPLPLTDVLLYVAFFLTGICVAAPGAMLPLLMLHWHLSDAAAGTLLFGFFVGSSVGGLCARGSLRRVLLLGCVAVGSAAVALGLQAEIAPILCVAAFGFGLGLCMTAISLQQSRAHGDRRVAELTRLNLVWATGALSGPAVCLRLAAAHGPAFVFRLFAGAFLVLALLVAAQSHDLWQSAPASPRDDRTPRLRGVVATLLMIPLATGLESAAGGWLSTYASRTGLHLAGDIGLASVFWAGMLLCRFAYTTRWFSSRVTFALRVNTVLALTGIVLLSIGRPVSLLFAGAVLLGWGLGALYPIALALLLKQTELGNVGFLIAGIGSACLPLLTGFISQAAQSLRAGLLFLVLPAACLVLLGNLSVRRPAA